MEKKNLYDEAVYNNCLQRIEKLNNDSTPQWGKMTAAQMLTHCAEVLEVANGKELKDTPFIAKLFKGLIKKMVLSEKPYPHSTKTHPQYEISSEQDFEKEKTRLNETINKFYNTDEETANKIVHPLFGKMTREEKGCSMYKHLDHHLAQFGV